MSDANEETGRDGRPVRTDGGETPNLGDYVHEPAVEPEDDDPNFAADTAEDSDDADATGAAGGATRRTATGAGTAGDATGRRRAPGAVDDRARGVQPSDDGAATADDPDLLAVVAESVDEGSVRGTIAGVTAVYGLLGAGVALLAVLVGLVAPPVIETTWNAYALVSEPALLTAVPVVSVALAVLAGGYAAARLDRTDGAVAGGLGAALGSVLATWLTVGGVALVAADPTVRIDGVLVVSVFLAVVGGGVAAGVALVADRLGVGAADTSTDPDAAVEDDRPERATPGEPVVDS